MRNEAELTGVERSLTAGNPSRQLEEHRTPDHTAAPKRSSYSGNSARRNYDIPRNRKCAGPIIKAIHQSQADAKHNE
jgi:hypothetical protein